MTIEFYCDTCKTIGYVYHDYDENQFELIQDCECAVEGSLV